jgi:hypothetical protein
MKVIPLTEARVRSNQAWADDNHLALISLKEDNCGSWCLCGARSYVENGALSWREMEGLMDRKQYVEEDKAALHELVHVPSGVLEPSCPWCRKEIRPKELGGEGA